MKKLEHERELSRLRVKKYREKIISQGKVRKEYYATPEQHSKLSKYLEKLQK